MGDFRDLEVWRQATQLAVTIYRTTVHFPNEERYGLTSQTRRSAISISSNIAEGAGRRGTAEFRRFVIIAGGSLHELRSQIYVSRLDLQSLASTTNVGSVLPPPAVTFTSAAVEIRVRQPSTYSPPNT